MTSFTNPQVEYHTTSTDCDCYNKQVTHANEPGYACKHMEVYQARECQTMRRFNSVDEARAARIQRNKETARIYRRMQYMEF